MVLSSLSLSPSFFLSLAHSKLGFSFYFSCKAWKKGWKNIKNGMLDDLIEHKCWTFWWYDNFSSGFPCFVINYREEANKEIYPKSIFSPQNPSVSLSTFTISRNCTHGLRLIANGVSPGDRVYLAVVISPRKRVTQKRKLKIVSVCIGRAALLKYFGKILDNIRGKKKLQKKNLKLTQGKIKRFFFVRIRLQTFSKIELGRKCDVLFRKQGKLSVTYLQYDFVTFGYVWFHLLEREERIV